MNWRSEVNRVLKCTDTICPEEKEEEQIQERACEELSHDWKRGRCRHGYLDPQPARQVETLSVGLHLCSTFPSSPLSVLFFNSYFPPLLLVPFLHFCPPSLFLQFSAILSLTSSHPLSNLSLVEVVYSQCVLLSQLITRKMPPRGFSRPRHSFVNIIVIII